MIARPHRWLAALPAALMLGGVPFANRVEPYVLGLPFLLAWIVGCVLLTAPVMALVRVLDRRSDRADDAGAGGPRR
jgi:4-hydroxybenzoate polyprenyltransferase